MSSVRAPLELTTLVERYVRRVEGHLNRLAEGRDPMGHLFAVERLARAARAEWWEAHRDGASGRPSR